MVQGESCFSLSNQTKSTPRIPPRQGVCIPFFGGVGAGVEGGRERANLSNLARLRLFALQALTPDSLKLQLSFYNKKSPGQFSER